MKKLLFLRFPAWMLQRSKTRSGLSLSHGHLRWLSRKYSLVLRGSGNWPSLRNHCCRRRRGAERRPPTHRRPRPTLRAPSLALPRRCPSHGPSPSPKRRGNGTCSFSGTVARTGLRTPRPRSMPGRPGPAAAHLHPSPQLPTPPHSAPRRKPAPRRRS